MGEAASLFHAWDVLMNIILPGDTRDEFLYGKLIGGDTKIPTAMVKFPKAMADQFGGLPDPEGDECLMWFLRNGAEEDDDIKVTRYEFHGARFVPSKDLDPEDLETRKDGYVYLPKKLRDGRHEESYFVVLIHEEAFTPKVESGMFEEVAWSPFGTIAEAAKQEDLNFERNPLLRRWDHV
jgi:hypothetical protein